MKKVSIITINLNNRDGLRKTAESVVSQTAYSEIEWIVIDGGSSDGSLTVLAEFQDKISYCVSEPDKGIYNAMNKGVVQAHGEYVLFLNSGDKLYTNDVISRFIAEAQYGKYDYCVGSILLSDKGDIVRAVHPPQQLSASFLLTSYLPHPSQFIKRMRFELQKYDETYQIVSDALFTARDIIKNDASYFALSYVISVFELGGVSSLAPSLVEKERMKMRRDVLPAVCYDEYREFTSVDYYCYRALKGTLLFRILTRIDNNLFLFVLLSFVNATVYFPFWVFRVACINVKRCFSK